MTQIIFIEPDGKRHEVDVENGETVMRAALANGIDGLVAECGGCLSCSTCHAYIDEAWVDRIPKPSEEEAVMVDCAVEVRENSRLTCQLIVSDEMEGMVVQIPESQY